ncbi:uncharacterized protein DUF4296 [Christiangramia gaetbulicola]|uniref:Uncharacterized protein DUF4296 n=1 Tax=Christiangramia gaetbulicola TaxID=703340 RepID=A0A2T6AL56_9FLAO|nr:DUF4296 domain-containing protein [Christiangramia gaetbulicola]PTX44553.1 uncharacterized protein DUF4296 [Christiangramia gaetbulicola]
MTDNFRNSVLYLFLFIVLASCQDLEKTEKPDDLIPEDKMVEVLTELSLVNAARNYNKQKLEETGIKPKEYIYEKFDIDSLQFERSNDYYTEKYDQYERIYDSVKVRLQILKTRLDSLREIEVRIEDSIKLAKKDSLKALDSLSVDSLKTGSLKSKKRDSLKKDIDSLIAPPVRFDSTSDRQN